MADFKELAGVRCCARGVRKITKNVHFAEEHALPPEPTTQHRTSLTPIDVLRAQVALRDGLPLVEVARILHTSVDVLEAYRLRERPR
jgi:hypothetical protein